VHAECYAPNAGAEIVLGEKKTLVNNFERISFNVGPTLLKWMGDADPETYDRIVAADREALSTTGYGNAIAQAYHHTILPLSSPRDARTEILWGKADFRCRFGRDPAGMWLPETACNDTVLGLLIDEGIGFTILAPAQASRIREIGDETWTDVSDGSIETRRPYRYSHPDGSGRSLIFFFYDADIARAVAFERGASSSEALLDLFVDKTAEQAVVHTATDGETYGHHHKFSELALAYALFDDAPTRGIETTSYEAWLASAEVDHEVEIAGGEGSSWSCAHGVGRWSRDCGCSTGGEPGWNQQWRAPLRAALEIAKNAADRTFASQGHVLLRDPWAAREDYVNVVIGAQPFDEFVAGHAIDSVHSDAARAAALLELQRNAMAMFTSCGWFFNDVGGIETVQILRYAARVFDLLEQLDGMRPVSEFMSALKQAQSNDPDIGTGADVFERAYAAR
jgi:alpha-amylase/alpha-mannosidase (GH57 family)